MKSTGEVMGIAENFPARSARRLPRPARRCRSTGNVFLSVCDSDKSAATILAQRLAHARIHDLRHGGTATALTSLGIPANVVNKVFQGGPRGRPHRERRHRARRQHAVRSWRARSTATRSAPRLCARASPASLPWRGLRRRVGHRGGAAARACRCSACRICTGRPRLSELGGGAYERRSAASRAPAEQWAETSHCRVSEAPPLGAFTALELMAAGGGQGLPRAVRHGHRARGMAFCYAGHSRSSAPAAIASDPGRGTRRRQRARSPASMSATGVELAGPLGTAFPLRG